RAQQVKAFEAHIELAIDLQMPMFLHERDASETFIEVLSAYRDRLSKVVVHCFTGEAAALHSYLDMDCHIGITGWLCDERRGTHLIPLMADIPDDRLMIETDAPYLMPRNIRPKPNNRHNQPHFLSYVCQAVADARGTDYASVAAATTANAIAFYAL
ncbi:MAG: TatD DNase family protein, partial [Candidatus Azotimanducaceae bacterium]